MTTTELVSVLGNVGLNSKTLIGLLPVFIGALAKAPSLWSDFNEKVHKAKTAKMAWLHEALRDSKHLDSPELFREIVVQQAYGYAYSNDEIEFAAAKPNPSAVLHDIRYGKAFAAMTADKKRFEPKKEPLLLRWMDLRLRLRITEIFVFIFFIGLFPSLVVLALEVKAGLMLLSQFAFGLWAMGTASRSASCAIRLCELTDERTCATSLRL